LQLSPHLSQAFHNPYRAAVYNSMTLRFWDYTVHAPTMRLQVSATITK